MSDLALAARLRARWAGLSGNSRGALWMIASGLGFTAMAVGIKLLGDRLDNFQIAFFPCLVGFIAIPTMSYVVSPAWRASKKALHRH